jgi:hypothetical protein
MVIPQDDMDIIAPFCCSCGCGGLLLLLLLLLLIE